MKILQAIEELRDILYFDDVNHDDIVDVLQEIAAESYKIGYEDGLIDAGHYEDKPFVAYGKKEDYE